MKKSSLSILTAIVCLFLFSCDEIKDLVDITFDTTLEQAMPVAVVSTNQMSTSIVLDATVDPEIEQYKNNIKDYEITKLQFAIENYVAPTEDEIYFNGVIGFGSKSSTSPTSSCNIEFYNITHVADTGPSEFTECTQKANEVADLLLTDNGLKIYMVGTFSRAPVTFDLKVTIDVEITANPL